MKAIASGLLLLQFLKGEKKINIDKMDLKDFLT
jgi:hypothetical protein